MDVSSRDIHIRLAMMSCEHYLKTRKLMDRPKDLPDELVRSRAGCFVSLYRYGRLRGCIGTISPVQACLADEIISNAVSAAVRDPRFSPVRWEELDGIDCSVDVLGEPEDIVSKEELDVKKYGVIVISGARRGLLLPDLEGVDTIDLQVSIVLQKAGIRPDEPFRMQRFPAVRHR